MKWNNPHLESILKKNKGMRTRDIKGLIESLQELLDKGEEMVFFEGTILCVEENGVCNCVTSTEPQM